jgi:hypothetical protein
MNEEFRKQHAMTVREIAEKAEPIMKKRLLDLAARYDDKAGRTSARPTSENATERL